MKKKTIKGKDIYIVDSHNQVLEAWERGPGHEQNIFSLDYHTDTRRAFHVYSQGRASSEFKSGLYLNLELRMKELVDQKISDYLAKRISLSQINDNLRHDEHLDFAVRTNIVNRVFVLAKNRNESSSNPHVYMAHGPENYQDHRIIEYSPLYEPDSAIEDSSLNEAIAKTLSFVPSFFDNYILDIDCDYFNTDKSLFPESCDSFKHLIRGASFITIALEPVCVKICRHEGCLLDSDAILERLVSLIEEV